MNAKAKTEVAPIEMQQLTANPPVTPTDMITKAIESGAGIDVLEKLMGLQERYDATQARKAFDEALAAAKAEIPTIERNRTVAYNDTFYKHEDMAKIAEVVSPILSAHGLSYRYRTDTAENAVTVTCIISHRDGHSEENSLSTAPDKSGGKNAIQAIGSAVTYLQRYTLKAALGLASGEDDDGQAAGGPVRLSMGQAKEWIRTDHILKTIDECPTHRRLDNMRARFEAVAFLPQSMVATFIERCDQREIELDRKLADMDKANEAEPELPEQPEEIFPYENSERDIVIRRQDAEPATVITSEEFDQLEQQNIASDYQQVLDDFAAEMAKYPNSPETQSEIRSEYEPQMEGASDDEWRQFRAIAGRE